jgi:hypothetical protein
MQLGLLRANRPTTNHRCGSCQMDVPHKIQYAAERLRQGHKVYRITVRDFLGHFGAERRGAVKVEAIQNILDSLGLETEPNFRSAWIDEPIWLRLKANASGSRFHSLCLDGSDESPCAWRCPEPAELDPNRLD